MPACVWLWVMEDLQFSQFRVQRKRHAAAPGCPTFYLIGAFSGRSRHGSLRQWRSFRKPREPHRRLSPLAAGLDAQEDRVQLALTLRMTVAAVAGLPEIAPALALPLPLWTVLTALIVTQMSIGRSLKTSVDYFVGTVGGTIYGAALALLIPHDSEWALLLGRPSSGASPSEEKRRAWRSAVENPNSSSAIPARARRCSTG